MNINRHEDKCNFTLNLKPFFAGLMFVFVFGFVVSCGKSLTPESPNSPGLNTPDPLPAENLTPKTQILASWSTFTNTVYRYAVDYPANSQVEITHKDMSVITIHTGSIEPIILLAKTDYLPGDVTFYLDTEARGQRLIGENLWMEYVLPEGYCDGPKCSPSIYALQMERNRILYSVTIYSQNEINELQKQILATLKILTE